VQKKTNLVLNAKLVEIQTSKKQFILELFFTQVGIESFRSTLIETPLVNENGLIVEKNSLTTIGPKMSLQTLKMKIIHSLILVIMNLQKFRQMVCL
jgi:hypothetical protein